MRSGSMLIWKMTGRMRRGAGGRQPGGAKNGETMFSVPSSFREGERERVFDVAIVVIVSEVRVRQ